MVQRRPRACRRLAAVASARGAARRCTDGGWKAAGLVEVAAIFGRMVGRWSSVEWLRTLDQYDVRRTTYSEYVELHAEASSSVPKHRVVFSIATLSTQSHGSGKRTPVSRPPFRECLWEESPTGPRGRSSGSDRLPAQPTGRRCDIQAASWRRLFWSRLPPRKPAIAKTCCSSAVDRVWFPDPQL